MDPQDFTARIQDMKTLMYRICCTQLANQSDREEAVQECVAIAWQKLDQLKVKSAFKAWVLRILVNQCHDIQRHNARFIVHKDEALLGNSSEVAPAWEIQADVSFPTEESRALHDALFRLPGDQRIVLALYYLGGFSTREIAKICGVRPGAVRTRMTRGRERLREMLGDSIPKATNYDLETPLKQPLLEGGGKDV
jgi:RNA polymerase sigma-70 factor (ECF subfamily)